mgnify:CR=1 FL=1
MRIAAQTVITSTGGQTVAALVAQAATGETQGVASSALVTLGGVAELRRLDEFFRQARASLVSIQLIRTVRAGRGSGLTHSVSAGIGTRARRRGAGRPGERATGSGAGRSVETRIRSEAIGTECLAESTGEEERESDETESV